MKVLAKSMSLMVVVILLSSCASIVSRSQWPLTINTNPSGAKIEITDKSGFTVYVGNSPATIRLKSGAGYFSKQSYSVKLTLDGYDEKIFPLECNLNGWYVGNIFFGGLIGILIVDPSTGAMYRLEREYVEETLTKTLSSVDPSLRIMNINDLPEGMKEHLVAIK